MKVGRKPKLDPTTHAIVRARVRQRETYLSIARDYGVSESTIARVVGRRDRLGRPPTPARCRLCGSAECRRFSLSYHAPRTRTSRGAGSAVLCEACWRNLVNRALTA